MRNLNIKKTLLKRRGLFLTGYFSQRNTNRTSESNTEIQVSLDDSENGYWLLEENSNSDSNLDESNSNSASSNPRWTSRWIQLDTPIRNLEYDLFNEQAQSRSLSEDVDQSSDNRHDQSTTQDRNQLSPVSLNASREEQSSPLSRIIQEIRARSRRNVMHRLSANPLNSRINTGMMDEIADLTEDANDDVAAGIADEINDNEFTSDRQQEDLDIRLFGNTSNVGSREDSLRIRREIRLLTRQVDNMQRLCR